MHAQLIRSYIQRQWEFTYTKLYYTQTSKSGVSWTDDILIHPATLSQWPYAPLDWHSKGSTSVKWTAVLEGTFLKFPWTCEQSKATKYHIRVGPCDTSDLMTVFPCFWTLKLQWKIIFLSSLVLLFLRHRKDFQQVWFGCVKQGIRLQSFLKTASSILPTALRDKYKPQVVVGWCISRTQFQWP